LTSETLLLYYGPETSTEHEKKYRVLHLKKKVDSVSEELGHPVCVLFAYAV